MEQAPLPRHERTWRHPSEVAAEQRELFAAEPTSRSTRVLAFTSGAMGLLAIGMLMVAVTPNGTDAPIAIGSTPSTVTNAAAAPTRAALAEPPAVDSSAARQQPTASAAFGLRSEPGVRATPIGDGQFAVVTRASLRDTSESVVDVMLPDGQHSLGSIVTASDDTVVVALANRADGHAVATRQPHDGDLVTVMASPPISITYADISSLQVDEGTPVLDESGDLIGLCSHGSDDGEVRLIDVSAELAAATNVVP